MDEKKATSSGEDDSNRPRQEGGGDAPTTPEPERQPSPVVEGLNDEDEGDESPGNDTSLGRSDADFEFPRDPGDLIRIGQGPEGPHTILNPPTSSPGLIQQERERRRAEDVWIAGEVDEAVRAMETSTERERQLRVEARRQEEKDEKDEKEEKEEKKEEEEKTDRRGRPRQGGRCRDPERRRDRSRSRSPRRDRGRSQRRRSRSRSRGRSYASHSSSYSSSSMHSARSGSSSRHERKEREERDRVERRRQWQEARRAEREEKLEEARNKPPKEFGQGVFYHIAPPNTPTVGNQLLACASVEGGNWGRLVNYTNACEAYHSRGMCPRRDCRYFHAEPGDVVQGGTGDSTNIIGQGDVLVLAMLERKLKQLRPEKKAIWEKAFNPNEQAFTTLMGREGRRLEADNRAAEAAARFASLRRIAAGRQQFRIEGVHSIEKIAAQAERVAGLIGPESSSSSSAGATPRRGPQHLMIEGSPGHTFAAQVRPGQFGPYTGSLSAIDQRPAGAQVLITEAENTSRRLCPVAMCNYWGCTTDPSSVNIRQNGYVCPLCLRHVFCSRECAQQAGHPGRSIQCSAHHGWE